MQSRTHTCGELRIADCGKQVMLAGWLENFREVGAELGFVVIRDFYGTTQLVIETAEMMKTFKAITKESTIQVTGTVRERSSKNRECFCVKMIILISLPRKFSSVVPRF